MASVAPWCLLLLLSCTKAVCLCPCVQLYGWQACLVPGQRRASSSRWTLATELQLTASLSPPASSSGWPLSSVFLSPGLCPDKNTEVSKYRLHFLGQCCTATPSSLFSEHIYDFKTHARAHTPKRTHRYMHVCTCTHARTHIHTHTEVTL